MRFQPHVSRSSDADAVYVYLSPAGVARTRKLGDLRMVDYALDGSVVGVEFLDVGGGVDLRGIPERERIEKLLLPLNLQIFA